MSRTRAWCLTINNYTDVDLDQFEKPKFKKQIGYYVYGKEVGESGTPHLQIFLYYNNAKTFNEVKKHFSSAHIEQAQAKKLVNAVNYCKKGEQPHQEWCEFKEKGENFGLNADFKEYGEPPIHQGQRTDLNEVKDKVMSGRTTVKEIIEADPIVYHQYGRVLDKLEDIKISKQFRTEMTKGIWLYGTTGIGKSERFYKNYNPDTHYTWLFEKQGWNDNYNQQQYVILDDFRGQMKFSDLLRMIDKHPNFCASRRGRVSMPFTSEYVVITSSLPPDEVYSNLSKNDKMEQLLRRIEVVNINDCPDYELPF